MLALLLATQCACHIFMGSRYHSSRPESKKTSVTLNPDEPHIAVIHAGKGEQVQAQDEGLFYNEAISVVQDESEEDSGPLPNREIEAGEILPYPLEEEEFEIEQERLDKTHSAMFEKYDEYKSETIVEIQVVELKKMLDYMVELRRTREHDNIIAIELKRNAEEDDEEMMSNEMDGSQNESKGEGGEDEGEEGEGDSLESWEKGTEEDGEEHDEEERDDPFEDDKSGEINIDEPDAEHQEEEDNWDAANLESSDEEEEDLSEKALEVAEKEESSELGIESDEEEDKDWDEAVDLEDQEEAEADASEKSGESETSEEHHTAEDDEQYMSDADKLKEKHATAKEHVNSFSRDGGKLEANFDQLPNMMVVAEGLMKIYNELFLDFPKESNDAQSSAELEKVYESIKTFIQDIVNRKDQLFKEVDYEKAHLEAVGYSREEVLGYYNFKSLWENLEHQASPNDEDWIQKKKILDLETSEFVTNIKSAMSSVTNVESQQDLIWNETVFIRDQMASEKAVSVKEKVTGLPSLVEKLLDIKFKIDENLNQLSLALKNVHAQKREFKEQLVGMQMYLGVNEKMEGASSWSVLWLLFLVGLFWDKYL